MKDLILLLLFFCSVISVKAQAQAQTNIDSLSMYQVLDILSGAAEQDSIKFEGVSINASYVFTTSGKYRILQYYTDMISRRTIYIEAESCSIRLIYANKLECLAVRINERGRIKRYFYNQE